MKKNLLLLLASALFLFGALAQERPPHAKLSPQLQMLVSSDADQVQFAKRHVHLRSVRGAAEPFVKAFVEYNGNPKVLEAYGVRIHTVAGGFATVEIPISALEKISNDPNVIRVEEARRLKPTLDKSVPETGANKIWGTPNRPLAPASWGGNTGKGVVVGIVDTGIDLNHADFKDATGKTRILSLWDQSTDTLGTHPAGFAYGNECTSQQIDALSQKTDLAVADSFDNKVTVMRGGGGGAFGSASTAVGNIPNQIAVADFNGDGNLDLAITNAGDGTISIMPGNGNGTFGAPSTVQVAAGFQVVFVATADLNGDGKADLVALLANDTRVAVLLGNGDGTFGGTPNNNSTGFTGPPLFYSAGNGPTWVAIGDLNGDGHPDLAVTNYNDGSVSIFLNNGDGTFGAKTDFPVRFGPAGHQSPVGVSAVAIGDLNGDGLPDLALAGEFFAGFDVLLGNGDGTFQAAQSFATGPFERAIALGDFRGNGKLDVALRSYSHSISVLLGNGDGTFGASKDYEAGGNIEPYFSRNALAVGDFTGDGKLDIAYLVSTMPGAPKTHLFNDTVAVLPGNGDGTFGAPINSLTGSGNSTGFAAGNLHSSVCTEADEEGHGTHVAGIAAGNGSATGNGKEAYRYIGMAPNASLIVVKTTGLSDDNVNAVKYIEDKAASLGMPAVVTNISLGYDVGPHDGTSAFEAMLGELTGAGKVVVVAAGNEADTRRHARGTVADKRTENVNLLVQSGLNEVLLDVWYPGSDVFGVKLFGPTPACLTVPAANTFIYKGNPTVAFDTACGRVTFMTPATDATNGDNEIIIHMENGASALQSGSWAISLTGAGCGAATCVTNGSFNIWLDRGFCLNGICPAFEDHIDANSTVEIPGTATRVITVGSYVTKDSWTSSNGDAFDPGCLFTLQTEPQNCPGVFAGAISSFSSLGPRRACTKVTNPICTNAIQKPELAAPGEQIMSSYAAGTAREVYFPAGRQPACDASSTPPPPPLTSKPSICVDPDGQHIIEEGTSMAAPHVTGAVALLLAQNPALTADQVKTALQSTRTDFFTGATPNNTWGYGKLAVDLADNAISPRVPVPNVVGLTQAAATADIIAANLTVGTVTEASSTTVPKGNVISQSPVAGSFVVQGSAVNLVVSCGTSVPNVVGLTQAAAETALTTANLVVGAVAQTNSTTVPKGEVISENPPAGTCAALQSAVDLVVSCGTKVPNVVALTQAAAQAALTAANLVVGTVTQSSSTIVQKGNVISENPGAGTCVALASSVDLVVSSGTSVPNVIGLTEAAADAAIAAANLVVGTVTHANSPNVPAGDVISESPAAGTSVDLGSPVDLVISSGPLALIVPNVVGLTQAAATTAIQNAGLVVGTVTQASSAIVPAGKVISENPAAGTSVAPGSSVNLVVSTGPAPVNVPNVVGLTQAAATTAIQNAGLVAGTVTQASSAIVPAGKVISENPAAGTSLAPGSSVNLVVSTGPAFTDVTALVTITRSGLVYNRTTNTFDSLVTIKNSSASILTGPLILAVNQITPLSVTLSNSTGLTSSGNPYVSLTVPAGGLSPGQSISNVLLKFSNPNRVVFTFTNLVFALH
jgi:beta-lactam-binding protein with PASTA domain